MKKLFLILIFFSIAWINASAQENITKEEIYSKVFNPAFSEDFKDEEVVITGEFFKPKAWEPYMYPSKVKKYVMFQCVDVGSQGNSDPLSGETRGDLFCIDKSKADVIFTLKKGDKLKLTGKTYTYSYGNNLFNMVFFMTTTVEKE